MFLLIVIANVNSLRYFSQNLSLQVETAKSRALENLELAARFVKSSPAERMQLAHVRDLARSAGFAEIALVETELLQSDENGVSRHVDTEMLDRLRSVYSLDKEIAGALGRSLPATVSERYRDDRGLAVRSVAYHFVSDKGERLTLVATIPAETEAILSRFSLLNALFQFVSVAAAFTIAILLLRITLKPYRQIKSEAIASRVAQTNQVESVDFAVETFQRVIAELRDKERKLQELYAQQKERAAALETYNEYILSNMPSGLISCDTSGIITTFNQAASAILRLDPDATAGRHYETALADYPTVVEMIAAALSQGEPRNLLETELEGEGRGRVWLNLNCSLVRDDRQSVKGAMVLISDITEIRKLEADIAVKEQLAVLGEMSAGLAHQLRNSLGAVVGFAQLLRKLTAGGDRLSEIVTNILEEAKTTEEMLTRFLKLSRSEELALRETDFSEIQRPLEMHFAEQVKEKGIKLLFFVPDDIPPLTCDPLLIGNALTNLVQNSMDASLPGGEVVVSSRYLRQTQTVEITVRDNGTGISRDQLDKLFTPFYTFGKTAGTGLGLSLARKWIVSHQGIIECQSAPGKGTTFTIKLPQRPANPTVEQRKAKIALAKE